jgi:hypothetical protein
LSGTDLAKRTGTGGDDGTIERRRPDPVIPRNRKVCGIFPIFWSDWGGQQHYAVNVACLEGVDPYKQETTLIDGKSF